MKSIVIIIISYLLGSISFGYLVAKQMKVDLRKHGSGNIGTTNAFRILGPIPGLAVFVGDCLKGYISALLGFNVGGESLAVFAGLAAMLGHSYPVFLGFKGGKVIATGVGVLLALDWRIALLTLLVWSITLFIFRYVSLASLVAAASVVVTLILFQEPLPYIIFGLVGAGFAYYKHIPNIKRLRSGTELKVGRKKGKEDR